MKAQERLTGSHYFELLCRNFATELYSLGISFFVGVLFVRGLCVNCWRTDCLSNGFCILQELHAYLEDCICRNLTGRCSGLIRRNKDQMDTHMIGTRPHPYAKTFTSFYTMYLVLEYHSWKIYRKIFQFSMNLKEQNLSKVTNLFKIFFESLPQHRSIEWNLYDTQCKNFHSLKTSRFLW